MRETSPKLSVHIITCPTESGEYPLPKLWRAKCRSTTPFIYTLWRSTDFRVQNNECGILFWLSQKVHNGIVLILWNVVAVVLVSIYIGGNLQERGLSKKTLYSARHTNIYPSRAVILGYRTRVIIKTKTLQNIGSLPKA
jgi:hypothetical protein